MTEQNKQPDGEQTNSDGDVGAGEGGADTSGAGNILAGVQPTGNKDEKTERRHD